MSNYKAIKVKISQMTHSQADKYIDKMYNNGVITIAQLKALDEFLFRINASN